MEKINEKEKRDRKAKEVLKMLKKPVGQLMNAMVYYSHLFIIDNLLRANCEDFFWTDPLQSGKFVYVQDLPDGTCKEVNPDGSELKLELLLLRGTEEDVHFSYFYENEDGTETILNGSFRLAKN